MKRAWYRVCDVYGSSVAMEARRDADVPAVPRTRTWSTHLITSQGCHDPGKTDCTTLPWSMRDRHMERSRSGPESIVMPLGMAETLNREVQMRPPLCCSCVQGL